VVFGFTENSYTARIFAYLNDPLYCSKSNDFNHSASQLSDGICYIMLCTEDKKRINFGQAIQHVYFFLCWIRVPCCLRKICTAVEALDLEA